MPMQSLYVSHMDSEISIGLIVMANNMLRKLELKTQANVIPAIKLASYSAYMLEDLSSLNSTLTIPHVNAHAHAPVTAARWGHGC